MEQLLLNMVEELQTRNEALARELGKAQAEMEYWKNKYYDNLADTDLVEQRTEKNTR